MFGQLDIDSYLNKLALFLTFLLRPSIFLTSHLILQHKKQPLEQAFWRAGIHTETDNH